MPHTRWCRFKGKVRTFSWGSVLIAAMFTKITGPHEEKKKKKNIEALLIWVITVVPNSWLGVNDLTEQSFI